MGQTWKLLLVILAMFLLQGILVWFQTQRLRKTYEAVRASNPIVAVGRSKKLGRSKIALLGISNDGIVQNAYALTGITVFSTFHKIPELEGNSCATLIESFRANPKEEYIYHALNSAQNKLSESTNEEQI